MQETLWIVQYLRAARLEGGVVHHPERPRIYRLVAFSGDTVWGINTETDVLTKVNRKTSDGSGRVMNMQAFTTPAAANTAADRIAAEIAAEETRTALQHEQEAAAKLASLQAMYPAVQPNTTTSTTGTGDGGAGDADAPKPMQVTSTFTIKSTKKKEPDAPQE